MSFTRWFFRLLPLFLVIHVTTSLIFGYWDVRLSDQYLYQEQMSRIHYIRTLQAHLITGALIAILLSLIFAAYHFRKQTETTTTSVMINQIPLSVVLISLLIAGIKIHLVWLDSHLSDPQGLLWTFVAIASSVILFWTLRKLFAFLLSNRVGKFFFIVSFLCLFTWTAIHILHSLPRRGNTGHPNGKNVLLIVIDTLRQDHLSTYGSPQKTTPSMDAFAKEAVQYQTAISQSPWTTPSHAALFTGQYPSRNGVDGRNIHLHPDENTLAEVLSRNGYQTAGFINNVYIRRQTGLAQGFQEYEEFWGRNEGSSILLFVEFIRNRFYPRTDKGATETNQAVANWLDHDWNSNNPFFLFTHYMEPHALYGSTKEYLGQFLPDGISPEDARHVNQDPELYICNKLQMTDRDFEILRGLYSSDIRYLDNRIGELLDLLRSRKLLDNTIVILTADHGENFGDHHLMSHELSIYDTLLRVPLLIRYPGGLSAGLQVEIPVQLIDIFPSLLSVLGIHDARLHLQGSTLLPDQIQNRKQEYVFVEYNNSRAVDHIQRRFGKDLILNPVYQPKILKAVRSSGWKFIWGTDGTRELYAIDKDPKETSNLFQSDPETAKRMEQALKDWASSFRPSNYYKQEDISNEALRELRSLGYIQ